MRPFIKILLVLLAVFPLWITILAFGAASSSTSMDLWKEKINEKLLNIKDRKIQVADLIAADHPIGPEDDELLKTSLTYDVDISELRYQGISDIGVKFYDEQGTLKRLYRFSAKLAVQEQVPVATHGLEQGKVIEADDFKVDWVDASSFRSAPARASDLVGRTLRAQVTEGEPIYEPSLFVKTLISRGDRVKIDVVTPGLILTTFGIAQEAGGKGQTIRVLQVDSKKEISGRVLDGHSVEVRL